MKTPQLLNLAWVKGQGERYTDAVGSDTWNYMFDLANYYIERLGTMYGVDWVSLYDPLYKVGTVSATDTFTLDPDEVRKLSDQTEDYVRIRHTDGTSISKYKVVKANQLTQYVNDQACAKLGSRLKFSKPFASTDPQYGGTIFAPIYGTFDQLTDEKSTVPVDNPLWVVCMIAYDLALHDILRKDISADILDEAKDIFTGMRNDNDAAQENRANGYDMSGIG